VSIDQNDLSHCHSLSVLTLQLKRDLSTNEVPAFECWSLFGLISLPATARAIDEIGFGNSRIGVEMMKSIQHTKRWQMDD
jgi:hypothetical protein